MTYDAASHQLIMFGGWDPVTKNPIALNDTWEFVWNVSPGSGNWTTFNSSSAPSPRFDAAAAYDSSEGEVVLFGGSTMTGALLGDTWLWNSTHWVKASLPLGDQAPSGRMGAAMAPSPSPGASPNGTDMPLFLFSGIGNNRSLETDSWYFGNLSVSVFPPRITPSTLDVNVQGNLSVTAFGGNAAFYHYQWNGLPTGCTSANLSTLSCAPSAANSYDISVTVMDASTGAAMTSLPSLWSVNSAPTIQTFTIAPSPAVVSQQVSVNVIPGGGTSPFTYVFTGLPPGCAPRNSASFSCYPQASGTFEVVVTATDSDGQRANDTTFLIVQVASSPASAAWQYLVEALIIGAIGVVAAVLIRRSLRSRGQRALEPTGRDSRNPPSASDQGGKRPDSEDPPVTSGSHQPSSEH